MIYYNNNIMAVDKMRNIKGGVVLTYVTLVFSIISSLLITPIILKYVGDKNYGLYTLSISITSWLTVITNALSASFIRYAVLDEQEYGNSKRISTIYLKLLSLFSVLFLAIGIATISVLFFSGITLPQYSEGDNKLLYLLLLISTIQTSLSIIFSLFTLFLSFKQRFIIIKSIALSIAILTLLLKLISAIVFKSIVLILLVDLVSTLVSGGLSLFFAIKFSKMSFAIKESLKKNKKMVFSILAFSSFILLNVLSEQLNNSIDKIVLGFFVNAESVTKYQLSFIFPQYLSTIPVSIATLFIPKVNEYVARGDKEKVDALFLSVSKFQAVFVILIVGGYISCGKDFILLWLGQNNLDVFYYGLVLIIVHSIPLCVNIAIEIQRAYGKHKFRAISMLIISLLNALTSTVCVLIFPKEQAIWICIICTAVTKIIGVWILFNVYNAVAIKLPIRRFIMSFSTIIVFALLSYVNSIAAARIVSYFTQRTLWFFLAKGGAFVISFIGIELLFDNRFWKGIIKKQ